MLFTIIFPNTLKVTHPRYLQRGSARLLRLHVADCADVPKEVKRLKGVSWTFKAQHIAAAIDAVIVRMHSEEDRTFGRDDFKVCACAYARQMGTNRC